MRFLNTLIFICLSTSFFAQEKHALIVAVGNYPERSEGGRKWSNLSSGNDVDLVMEMLESQKFKSSNITVLADQAATPDAVMNAFDLMIGKLQKGDIVYFHYSGHGQQVEDCDPKKFKNL